MAGGGWRLAMASQPAEAIGRAARDRRLAGLFGLEALGGQDLFWHPEASWLPPSYSAYDYVIGGLIALLILGLANAQAADAGKPLRGPDPLARRNKLRALPAALSTPEFLGDGGSRPGGWHHSTGSWYLSSPSA